MTHRRDRSRNRTFSGLRVAKTVSDFEEKIASVLSLSSNQQTFSLDAARTSFVQHVSSEYKRYEMKGDTVVFRKNLDHILRKIPQSSDRILLCYFLIDMGMGPSALKAQLVGGVVGSITPTRNESEIIGDAALAKLTGSFDQLAVIFDWLQVVLTSTMHMYTQQLEKLIWEWRRDYPMHAMLLAEISLKYFRVYTGYMPEKLPEMFKQALKSANQCTRDVAVRVLVKVFEMYKDLEFWDTFKGISGEICTLLGSDAMKQSPSSETLDSFYSVFEHNPEFLDYVVFKESDPFKMMGVDLRLLPFMYRYSTRSKSEVQWDAKIAWCTVLATTEALQPVTSSKNTCVPLVSNEHVLRAIGDFCYVQNVGVLSSSDGAKIAEWITKVFKRLTVLNKASLEESSDMIAGLTYAIFGLIKHMDAKNYQVSEVRPVIERALKQTRNPLVMEAFCKLSEVSEVHLACLEWTNVKSSLFPLLLGIIVTSDDEKILAPVVRTLSRIDFGVSSYTWSVVTQISRLLSHKSRDVRMGCVTLVVSHQQNLMQVPSMLAAYIAVERDSALRVSAIASIRVQTVSVVELLAPLLYDDDVEVVDTVLRKFCQSPVATPAIVRYIGETVQIRGQMDYRNRTRVQSMSVIAELRPEYLGPFVVVLGDVIMSFEQQTKRSLQVLRTVIELTEEDYDHRKVLSLLLDTTRDHSMIGRLMAALDVLEMVIRRFNILESERYTIMIAIVDLSKAVSNPRIRLKLYELLGQIGPVRLKTMHNVRISDDDAKMPSRRLMFRQNLDESGVSVALSVALRTLADPSRQIVHPVACDAIFGIMACQKGKIPGGMIDLIVDCMKNMLRTDIWMSVVKQLGCVLEFFGDRVEQLLPDVIALICEKWGKLADDGLIFGDLIAMMAQQFLGLFSPYAGRIVQVLLEDLDMVSENRVKCVLPVIRSLQWSLQSCDHLVVSRILSLIDRFALSTSTAHSLLRCLRHVLGYLPCEKFCGQIVRTISNVISINEELKGDRYIHEVMCILLVNMRNTFLPYLSISHDLSDLIMSKEPGKRLMGSVHDGLPFSGDDDAMRFRMNERTTSTANVEQDVSESAEVPNVMGVPLPNENWNALEWNSWMNVVIAFYIGRHDVIRECRALSERDFNVRKILFPWAFARWRSDDGRECYRKVMESRTAPHEVIRDFLAVADVMNIVGIPSVEKGGGRELSTVSLETGEYPLSLRYHENVYRNGGERTNMLNSEELVRLYRVLGFKRAAQELGATLDELTAEKAERLEHFAEAERKYSLRNSPEDRVGRLKCLEKLGKYQTLNSIVHDGDVGFVAGVAWRMKDNEEFKKVMSMATVSEDLTSIFYSVVYDVMCKNTDDSVLARLASIRQKSLSDIFPTIGQDYDRVLNAVCWAGLLFTLQEVIDIKREEKLVFTKSTEEKHKVMKFIEQRVVRWGNRFGQLKDSPPAMYDFIRVISLHLSEKELEPFYLKFLEANNVCEELNSIVKGRIGKSDMRTYIHLKRRGPNEKTLQRLRKLVEDYPNNLTYVELFAKFNNEMNKKEDAIRLYRQAADLTPGDAGRWYTWSHACFEFGKTKSGEAAAHLFRMAIEGSVAGVSLPNAKTLGLMLIIAQILFDHGTTDIFERMDKEISFLRPDAWVSILPQIVARMTAPKEDLRNVVRKILLRIGGDAPHALLYNMLSPLRSDDTTRASMAREIIDNLRTKFPDLVDSTTNFADELLRVAAPAYELWPTAIENAARDFEQGLYNQVDATVKWIMPLYDERNKGPRALYDIAFDSRHGNTLREAKMLFDHYIETQDQVFLGRAWLLFAAVHREARDMAPRMVDLRDASPPLATLRDSVLTVPGTFSYGNPLVLFQSIRRDIEVMASKQRPKRMQFVGSNGQTYQFLLKTNEDTRLDERVMQVFNFISEAIMVSNSTFKAHLTLTTYKVVPLSAEFGLIGWVTDCDTAYGYVKGYRDWQGKEMNEQNISAGKRAQLGASVTVQQLCAIYDRICAGNSQADDLRNVIVMMSDDATDWLQRRTVFATSLAATSMTGHILGLGDRHMQNIMMKKHTCKLVHIDYGDCFEVTQHRAKFPEMVPFRLTRLFTNALEVTGSNGGTFAQACESVMTVMRSNREQILGLLKAFEYDPLVVYETGQQVKFLDRINAKLQGREFEDDKVYSEEEQVQRLIKIATDKRNLAQMYAGWGAFW